MLMNNPQSGEHPDSETPTRDAYLAFCRVIIFIWMLPAMKGSETIPETQQLLFAFVSLFTSGYCELGVDDLEDFIKQEVYSLYGPKLFLATLGLALRTPSGPSTDPKLGQDIWQVLDIAARFAIGTESRPYYASSGLLPAIRELFERSDVQAIPIDTQWCIFRDAIDILECVASGHIYLNL